MSDLYLLGNGVSYRGALVPTNENLPAIRADLYCSAGKCLASFDANYGVRATGGGLAAIDGAVEEWQPVVASISGCKLQQLTAGKQPTLIVSANGKKAIRFTKVGLNDATNDKLPFVNGTGLWRNRTAMSYAFVFKAYDGAGATNRLMTVYNSAGSTWHQATLNPTTGALSIGGRCVNADTSQNVTITASTPNNQYHLVIGVMDYTNQAGYIYYNNALSSSAYDTSSTNATTTENLAGSPGPTIGGRSDDQENYHGEILWCAFWDEVLSEANRTQLTADLAAYYGLSVPFSSRTASPPLVALSGSNLAPNSTVTSDTGWDKTGATYNAGVSNGAGGSYQMTAVGQSIRTTSIITGITPGTYYTFSFDGKCTALPAPDVAITIQAYNASNVFVRNLVSIRMSWDAAETWREMSQTFVTEPGEVGVKLKIDYMNQTHSTASTVNLDNFRLHAGVGAARAPSTKGVFEGTQTRVDGLGNVEIKYPGESTFRPFFPFAIYGDTTRPSWQIYSDAGFNMNMWAWDNSAVAKAKACVSSYNPFGMFSAIDITQYVNASGSSPGDTALMTSRLDAITAAGNFPYVLFYYIDNENDYTEINRPVTVIGALRTYDGGRIPVYVLQGQTGLARKWKNGTYNLMDITGTYSGSDTAYSYPSEQRGASRLYQVGALEGQTVPVVIGQINRDVGNLYRARFWGSIGRGARGIGTWRDGYSVTAQRLENQVWYSQALTLRAEAEAAINLIRAPHWTTWSAASNDTGLDVYTRDASSLSHLIVVNETSASITSTITLTGLTYTASGVLDFFTGALRSTPTANVFSITVPAQEAYVLKLAR